MHSGRRKLPQQVPLMSQMQKEVNLTEDDPELRQCVKCHKTQCLEELGVNIGVQLVMKSLSDLASIWKNSSRDCRSVVCC